MQRRITAIGVVSSPEDRLPDKLVTWSRRDHQLTHPVLGANAAPGMSHVSPAFIPVFGDCIRMLRKVLYAPKGQPMLIAGSGTLGWDAAAVNLVEPGENVVSTEFPIAASAS